MKKILLIISFITINQIYSTEEKKEQSSSINQAKLDYEFLEAAKSDKIKKIKLLIDLGANINAQDDDFGYTALMWAAYYGQTETAKLLLDHGADINKKNKYGCTALMYAVRFGHAQTVELLLNYDASINDKDNSDGLTALMLATREDNLKIVEILLNHGASIDINNKDGKAALDMSNKKEIKSLIESKLISVSFSRSSESNSCCIIL